MTKVCAGGRAMLTCYLVLLVIAGHVTLGQGLEDPDDLEVTSIIRHHQGDIYTLPESDGVCRCRDGGGVMTVGPSEGCQCQCPSASATFRDDTGTCVSTLTECPLADFVSSSGPEKLPYVFMPLKHQLVHPTAEVALLGLEHGGTPLVSPVCVVTKGSILTQDGWKNMANTSTFEPPFRLFRDGGRTYVQWVGEEPARAAAEGRLVLVTLICRDAAQPGTPVFRPCLAFRVAGSPGASEAALSAPVKGEGGGLSSAEGAIIGLVVMCLSVTYVVAMTVYLRRKKRKEREKNLSKLAEEGGERNSKQRSGRSHRRPRNQRPSLVSSEDDSEHEDIEDLSLRGRRARKDGNISFTTAVVHEDGGRAGHHDGVDGIERVPRSHLAVVETFVEGDVGGSGSREMGVVQPVEPREGGADDIQGSQAKRKLYFNPAYFEPEMLQAPPPAAIEFLTRIREMITIAKSKMKAKTYQPSLVDIPEEDSDSHSRPMSRSTGRSSSMTVPVEEVEEVGGGEPVYASDHSVQSDSLERRPRDDDSRSSTLKRLAKRVNSHGQSIVSEIIRTLDLKPRLPAHAESVYVAHTPPRRPSAPKPPPPRPVNAREESPVETDDDFPELIKPSMLRSVLRDGKRLTDLNNTFENFRQEMMATFNRMKRVGEAISPKSTLNRVKNRNSSEASPICATEKGKEEVPSSEGKVQKWLQTLENKNMYSKMSETTSNVVFDSRTAMPRNSSPPPLPQKGNKPPTPPKKARIPPQRSISFTETKEQSSPPPGIPDQAKSSNKQRGSGNSTHVTRSLSLQNEHRHYDSNPRRPRQQVPLMPEDTLNTSFGSEDDSLNDLLNEAEAKVPKMIPSDSDSVYSDSKPRSKEKKPQKKEETYANSKSLSRQLPREEEITERNEIFNKKTGAKTMSRLVKNSDNMYEESSIVNNNGEDYEEHTYEEIQFPNDGRQKRRAPSKPKKENISEVHIDNNNEDDDGHYSIYSNPDSLVSEVTILGEDKCSSPIYSGCKVTIPVIDNMNGNKQGLDDGFEQDTLERRGKNVERSNSIVQDSLERPKIKKKSFANHEDSLDRTKAQRRLSLPGDKTRGDKSLLDIYASRSSIRSLRNYRNESPERSHSPTTSNPPSPKKTESFYFKNISSNSNLGVIKNDEPPKKLRTFKDYQEMNFHRGSSDTVESRNGSSPLPVTGSSINLNFRSTSPSNKEHRELKPPLPPKQVRSSDNEDASPQLPPKRSSVRPPLPMKTAKKSDSSDSESDRPRLPEKSRKKPSFDSLSRSSSGSSIPELTEEEARSILHGLLAHGPDSHRLSPLHEEDDSHFLGVRNTVADSSSRPSVPHSDSFNSSSPSTLTPTSSSSTPRSEDAEGTGSNTLGREVEHSLDRQLLRQQDSPGDPGSPGSEARVSGEFILSTTGRSPSLRRQSSLSREQKSGFLAKLRDITDDDVDGEALTKGMEIALALKAKSDLEKHFKEKSGADSIKRTWRKIIEKVDDSKEDKDRISIMKFQQYMASLERKEKEAKIKQEDSGYHSTDSSESANSKNSLVSIASGDSLPAATAAEIPSQVGTGHRPVRSLSYTSSLQRPVFQRSMSLQQLGRSSSQLELQSAPYGSGSFKRASMRASLGRRYLGADLDGLSIYVNNSFAAEDEGDQSNVAL